MDLGSLELQIFVSLTVVLGAAFVALVCDYLKGNNEQLREHNIELRVRKEEQERRLLLDPAGFIGQWLPGSQTARRAETGHGSVAASAGRAASPHEVMQSYADPDALADAETRAAQLHSRSGDDLYMAADIPPVTSRRNRNSRAKRSGGGPVRPQAAAYGDWVRPETIARVARRAEASAAYSSDIRDDLAEANGDAPAPLNASKNRDIREELPVNGKKPRGSGKRRDRETPNSTEPVVAAPVQAVQAEEPAVAEPVMSAEDASRLQSEIERVSQLERKPVTPPPGTILRPLTVPALRLDQELQRVADYAGAGNVTPGSWNSALLDEVIAASASRSNGSAVALVPVYNGQAEAAVGPRIMEPVRVPAKPAELAVPLPANHGQRAKRVVAEEAAPAATPSSEVSEEAVRSTTVQVAPVPIPASACSADSEELEFEIAGDTVELLPAVEDHAASFVKGVTSMEPASPAGAVPQSTFTGTETVEVRSELEMPAQVSFSADVDVVDPIVAEEPAFELTEVPAAEAEESSVAELPVIDELAVPGCGDASASASAQAEVEIAKESDFGAPRGGEESALVTAESAGGTTTESQLAALPIADLTAVTVGDHAFSPVAADGDIEIALEPDFAASVEGGESEWVVADAEVELTAELGFAASPVVEDVVDAAAGESVESVVAEAEVEFAMESEVVASPVVADVADPAGSESFELVAVEAEVEFVTESGVAASPVVADVAVPVGGDISEPVAVEAEVEFVTESEVAAPPVVESVTTPVDSASFEGVAADSDIAVPSVGADAAVPVGGDNSELVAAEAEVEFVTESEVDAPPVVEIVTTPVDSASFEGVAADSDIAAPSVGADAAVPVGGDISELVAAEAEVEFVTETEVAAPPVVESVTAPNAVEIPELVAAEPEVEFVMESEIAAPPVVADDASPIGGEISELVAVEAKGGFETESEVAAPPVVESVTAPVDGESFEWVAADSDIAVPSVVADVAVPVGGDNSELVAAEAEVEFVTETEVAAPPVVEDVTAPVDGESFEWVAADSDIAIPSVVADVAVVVGGDNSELVAAEAEVEFVTETEVAAPPVVEGVTAPVDGESFEWVAADSDIAVPSVGADAAVPVGSDISELVAAEAEVEFVAESEVAAPPVVESVTAPVDGESFEWVAADSDIAEPSVGADLAVPVGGDNSELVAAEADVEFVTETDVAAPPVVESVTALVDGESFEWVAADSDIAAPSVVADVAVPVGGDTSELAAAEAELEFAAPPVVESVTAPVDGESFEWVAADSDIAAPSVVADVAVPVGGDTSELAAAEAELEVAALPVVEDLAVPVGGEISELVPEAESEVETAPAPLPVASFSSTELEGDAVEPPPVWLPESVALAAEGDVFDVVAAPPSTADYGDIPVLQGPGAEFSFAVPEVLPEPGLVPETESADQPYAVPFSGQNELEPIVLISRVEEPTANSTPTASTPVEPPPFVYLTDEEMGVEPVASSSDSAAELEETPEIGFLPAAEGAFGPESVRPGVSTFARQGVVPIIDYLVTPPAVEKPGFSVGLTPEPALQTAPPALSDADSEVFDALPDLLPLDSDPSDTDAGPLPPPVVALAPNPPAVSQAPIDISSLRQPEPVPPPATVVPDLLLPTGMHDLSTWTRLMALPNPMTGILFVISLQNSDGSASSSGAPPSEANPAVEKLMLSFVREGDFGTRISDNEWVFVYSRDAAGFNQRRIGTVTEKLWDFQLRHLGMGGVSFKWGAVDVKSEPLGEALAAARDRMNQSSRARRQGSSGLANPRRVVNG